MAAATARAPDKSLLSFIADHLDKAIDCVTWHVPRHFSIVYQKRRCTTNPEHSSSGLVPADDGRRNASSEALRKAQGVHEADLKCKLYPWHLTKRGLILE